jgi:hypothetical protein
MQRCRGFTCPLYILTRRRASSRISPAVIRPS